MTEFPGVPRPLPEAIDWVRRSVPVLDNFLIGKINVGGLFTLTESVASSTLTDSRIGVETNIILVPTTANASAEIGAGTIYVSETSRVNGSVDITHANNAQTDRTFRYTLIG